MVIGLTLPVGIIDLELLEGRGGDMRKERPQVGAWTVEQKLAQA